MTDGLGAHTEEMDHDLKDQFMNRVGRAAMGVHSDGRDRWVSMNSVAAR